MKMHFSLSNGRPFTSFTFTEHVASDAMAKQTAIVHLPKKNGTTVPFFTVTPMRSAGSGHRCPRCGSFGVSVLEGVSVRRADEGEDRVMSCAVCGMQRVMG